MITECLLAMTIALSAGATTPLPAAETELSPSVIEAVVHATPAELWKVWSTPEGFRKMGAAKCDMDFRIGGVIRSVYDPRVELGSESTIQNEILAYEPERMMAFRIHQPPKGFPFPNAWKSTWSVATMTDLGNGSTLVRLAGMGYDTTQESQKMKAFFRAGNAYVMGLLQAAFDSAGTTPSGPASATGNR